MALTLSHRLRWLASACRQDGSALAPAPIGWDEVVALARRHRVQSLLSAGLAKRCITPPASIASDLRRDTQRIAADNLLAAVECRQLNEAFAKAGLPLLFVKGLTLSQLAFGQASLKMSRDVDLLVLPRDVAPAGALLAQLGYRLQEPADPNKLTRWHRWSKESGWMGPSGLLVELHSRLTDNPTLLPLLRADMGSQEVDVAPGITLPTLPRNALPAYLAVHGASSAWFRLKWLVDLDALVGEADPAALGGLHAAMRHHGAGHAADQALLLLSLSYDRPLPEALRARLLGDARTRWLVGEAIRQLEADDEPTERRGGTAGIHASQLLLGEHWSFPLSEGLRRAGEFVFRRFTAGGHAAPDRARRSRPRRGAIPAAPPSGRRQ